MSMSTHIVGIRPPDDTWLRMKAAYDVCMTADVPVPREVEQFFEGERPDSTGVKVQIKGTAAVTEWRQNMSEGFEVDVTLLPPGVKIVRFYNSY